MRRFGAHILVFMVGAVACAFVAFLFLGLLFRLFHHDPKDAELGLVGVIFRMVSYGSISVFYVVVACIGIVLRIRQVLLPFFQDVDDLSRDKLTFEF